MNIKVHYARSWNIKNINFMTIIPNVIGILDHEDLAPLYSGRQLTSTMIAHYQHLLKSKYNVGTLEDPVYGLHYEFSTQRVHFVQVLHVNQDHWIVISTMNSKPSMVLKRHS